MFRANRSFDRALLTAMKEGQHSVSERCIMRTRLAFLLPAKRRELEVGVTDIVVKAAGGAIPVASVVDGVYVGTWQDIIQYIIENLDVILEFVLAIIAIFLAKE